MATRHATAVAAPSTLAVDPARTRRPDNQEQPIHSLYAYLYVTDREEGLVVSTAATLLDGNPANNFLTRAATFNPDGLLRGAVNLSIAGKDESIPLTEVLEVRFRGEPAKIDKPAAVVALWDGSKLGATQTRIVDKQLKLSSVW